MAKKYIDADKLIALLSQRKKQLAQWTDKEYANQRIDEIDCILDVDINSLQQEQPDFPTTDEEVEKFLATHPKVEVPDKYKTPDWLFKKLEQEQPEVDIVTEYDEQFDSDPVYGKLANRNAGIAIARHFYELGLKAKEENK